MDSKNSPTLALFFGLNILFFTLTSASNGGCSPSSPPVPSPEPTLVPTPMPSPVVSPPMPNPILSPPMPSPEPMPVPCPPTPSPVLSPPVPSPEPMPVPCPPTPSPILSPPMPSPVPSPPMPCPVPSPSDPSPLAPTPSPTGTSGKCPIDTLKLGICANVLSGLLNIQLGQPSTQSCCSVVQGLVDLEAAVCLCTALKANVLGINLNVPISLSLLLNACNKKLPSGYECS